MGHNPVIDPEEGIRRTSDWMKNQYRLLINGISKEIPGGKVDEGEDPSDAAVRECLEETGVRCLNPKPLIFYHVRELNSHEFFRFILNVCGGYYKISVFYQFTLSVKMKYRMSYYHTRFLSKPACFPVP